MFQIEVRNRHDARWADGFQSLKNPSGVPVRRLSDRTVLPEVFKPDEVRPGLASVLSRST